MRHAVLLSLLYAGASAALPQRYLSDVQALTRAAPTLDTEGMSLTSSNGYPIRAFLIAVCAEEGQTLSGAGSLRAWVYHPRLARWMRNAELDKAVTLTGEDCQTYSDFTPLYLGDGRRLLYAADGVTVSGGTTVTVHHDGVTAL